MTTTTTCLHSPTNQRLVTTHQTPVVNIVNNRMLKVHAKAISESYVNVIHVIGLPMGSLYAGFIIKASFPLNNISQEQSIILKSEVVTISLVSASVIQRMEKIGF